MSLALETCDQVRNIFNNYNMNHLPGGMKTCIRQLLAVYVSEPKSEYLTEVCDAVDRFKIDMELKFWKALELPVKFVEEQAVKKFSGLGCTYDHMVSCCNKFTKLCHNTDAVSDIWKTTGSASIPPPHTVQTELNNFEIRSVAQINRIFGKYQSRDIERR